MAYEEEVQINGLRIQWPVDHFWFQGEMEVSK